MEETQKVNQGNVDHVNGNNNINNENNSSSPSPLKPAQQEVEVANSSLPSPSPSLSSSQPAATPNSPLSTTFNLIPDNLLNFSATPTTSHVIPSSLSNNTPSSPIPIPAPAAPAKPASTPISFEDFLQSFGGANLSDEEVAMKLQEYFEITEAQQAAATPPSADAQSALAIQMLDDDEKLAKQLQEQFYSEVTKEPKHNSWKPSNPIPVVASHFSNPPPPPPPSFSKSTSTNAPVLLTAQTASSLLKNIGTSTSTSSSETTTSTTTTSTTSTSTAKSEEPEKTEEEGEICLICHDSEFEEYIIIPTCEHRFCMDCAQRMLSNPPTNSYAPSFARRARKAGATGEAGTITCAMCESVTDLDPTTGIDGLKRRVKKRKAGDAFTNVCGEHGQSLQFYCFEHSMAVCFACIQHKGPHNNHRYDTLDSAVEKLKSESANKLLTINEKRQKIGEFKEAVENNKAQIAANSEKKLVEMQEYVVKVRKLLEKKEKDLETEIKRMADRKLLVAQQDLKWADEKLALLDKTIASVGVLLDEAAKTGEKNNNNGNNTTTNEEVCLKFVSGLSDCEELIADSVHLPAKQVNNEQYNFPPLSNAFSITTRAISNLSYTEALHGQGMHYDDDYSDEEADEY